MIKNFHLPLLSCVLVTSVICMEENPNKSNPNDKPNDRNSLPQINLRTPKTSSKTARQQDIVPLLALPTSNISTNTIQSPKKQDEEIKIVIPDQILKKESNRNLIRPLSYYDSRTTPASSSINNSIDKLVLDALRNKDYGTLNYLLFPDPNETDDYKNTPLIIATRKGNEEFVTLLLAQKKIDPNRKNIHGKTALYFAAEKGKDSLFRLLLRHPFCDSSILIDTQREIPTNVKIVDGKIVDSKIIKENIQENIQNFIPSHKKELRFESFCEITLIGEIKKQIALNYINPMSIDATISQIKERIDKIYQAQNKTMSCSSSDDDAQLPTKDDRQLPKTLLPDYATDQYIEQVFKYFQDKYLQEKEQLSKSKKQSRSSDNMLLSSDSITFNTSTPKIKKTKSKLKSYDTSDTLKKCQLIVSAASKNDLIQLKEILSFNCHWTDQEKNTLLMFAVSYNDEKIINLLLTKTEINPNEINERGMTAFLIAASKNLHNIVRLLMSFPAVDTSIKTTHGITADSLIDPLQKNLCKAIQNRIPLDTAVNICVKNMCKVSHLGLETIDTDQISDPNITEKTKAIKKLLLKESIDAHKKFIREMLLSRIHFSKTIKTSEATPKLPKEYINFRITT